MTEKLIYRKKLNTYETDRFGNFRVGMLMNDLQALTDRHAEILGFGRTFCSANNLAWVVTHYLIDIVRMPRENEEIIYSTWPSVMGALKAVRDFEVRDGGGNLMVAATSQWVLIDLAARRPIKLGGELPFVEVIDERALNGAFEKFPDFEISKTHIMNCRYDDLDVNQHINNAVYAVWATESAGFDFRNNHILSGIELNFKKEIGADVSGVQIDVQITDTITRHKIQAGGTERANIICHWRTATGV